ncbi:MAG: CorA family divalent cation transporter, partial [Thermoguttaceae bacterium]
MFRTLTVGDDLSVSMAEGLDRVRRDPGGGTRWIDLSKQDESSLEILAERFAFHPLTIEDCLHFDQRPKVESYEGYLFLVLHGFEVDWNRVGDAQALELHMFVG